MTQLVIDNLTQQFAGLTALDRVSFTLDGGTTAGTVLGIIGPNGAGKTTLINCISGLTHATSGRIIFNGTPIEKLPAYRVSRLGIARTYQNIRLFCDMTAIENVLLGQHQSGRASLLDSLLFLPRYRREKRQLHERGMSLLSRFGLAAIAEVLAENLPYGDQRRLEMARALASSPRLLLLDEPTAGMNAVETAAVGEQILQARQSGLSIILVEHDMALVGQVCDEVCVLNFGEVIARGTPDEVKANPAVVEAYLGKDESNGNRPPGAL